MKLRRAPAVSKLGAVKRISFATIAIFALVCAACGGNGISTLRPIPTSRFSLHHHGLDDSGHANTISIAHIPTEDFLGGDKGTHNVTWSQAAPYVTWAMTDQNYATAISNAGIKTVFYSDPDRQIP